MMTWALTLKVACLLLSITREGDLRCPFLQLIQDLPVRYIAHLVVFFHHAEILVTNTPLALWHQRIASIIRLADIAVNAFPTLLALALAISSLRSILATS